MRRALVYFFLACLPLAAGPAADLARAIHDNALDRDACYRVRDLTLFKEDIRIYLSDGYLIFSKPVAGRPIAAVFTTDVEGGDGEVILRPPSLAERRSLASFTGSPTLDTHFQASLFFFTGDVYQGLMAQIPNNPANRKAPEVGALMDEQWAQSLRNISANYEPRLVLDLMNASSRKPDFFSGVFRSATAGDFDVLYDPENPDQIAAGQFVDFIDELGAVAIIRLTHFGQTYSARRAVKERDVEVLFKLLDARRHHRFRDTELACRIGEALRFGRAHECFHRYEKVHAVS